MSFLDVPGARLHYETRGEGPTLLLIPGANGTGDMFSALAGFLSAQYRVVTYDRRGFSNSLLDGAQDYANRLATDADDAARLITHIGEQPATVVGFSSGGVIALRLLADRPDVVATLVPHEPAAFPFLPDAEHWAGFFDECYELYRRIGPIPALGKFVEQTFPEVDRIAIRNATNPENGLHVAANSTYWFERELRQYTSAEHDLDVLTRYAERIIPAIGQESTGYPTCRVSIELGKALGRPVLELPGGHIGCATEPAGFAAALLTALQTPTNGS
ncbi:alpha/beta hydrolase [Streptomyces sp. NPDC005953]|uniref:alpha/beta fold hydrolase n=1 Tax=Streptomyces sp. NPDC005953 TaxID=3156719 RepID=UPI0033EB49F5